MKIAVEKLAYEDTTLISTYDPSKWNTGSLIKQKIGLNPTDNYISCIPVGASNAMEESVSIPIFYPHVITISSTIDWVFLIENLATASALRRCVFYEYNKVSNTYVWKGFITLTLPTATAHTIRGFRVARYLHTTGTVDVSGTTVTGSGTQFQTERLAVGARIGFGSTNPNLISQWYVISAIGSDTGITLSTSAGTISSGTSYVIEELRPMVVTTNATLANGGLFIAKGINISDFILSGTTIAASVAGVDNLKLVYKISDASTTTMQVGCGLMIDDEVSKSSHTVYIINGTTSLICYKINVRSNDTITTGQMILTGSNIVITGTQAVVGTTSQVNNGRVAITSHGPGSGVKSLYWVTTTRIYRADILNITAGNLSWQSDSRIEMTPGGINTFAITNTLTSIEYISVADIFIVPTTGGTGLRSYITKYPTISGDAFNYVWGIDTKKLDGAASSSDASAIPANTLSTIFSVWSENGIAHIVRNGTAASTNRIIGFPLAAHWDFAATTGERLISPEISTPNNNNFSRVYVSEEGYTGLNAFAVGSEKYRVYYRTLGISDNSGTWTLLNKRGDLSHIGSATSIQFMFEFCIISIGLMIPAKIYGLSVLYEDLSTDSHYLPSADLSSKVTKTFAWKFSSVFGGTVPTLRIRLYNAITNSLLDDDDSVTQSGTWEKTINNASSWTSYNDTDKTNEITFIRFTPASIPDNIQVRAILTQL